MNANANVAMLEADACIALAEFVIAEIKDHERKNKNSTFGVLFYLETSEDTLDALLLGSPVNYKYMQITIVRKGRPELSEVYLEGRPIVASMHFTYNTFFVIDNSLPKGRIRLKKAHHREVMSIPVRKTHHRVIL